jgi:hypothetical protein
LLPEAAALRGARPRAPAQTFASSLRSLEAKRDSECAALEARDAGERARHADEARALEAAEAAAHARAAWLQARFEGLAVEAAALWQGAALLPSSLLGLGAPGCEPPSGGPARPGSDPACNVQLPQPAQWGPARWLFRHHGGAWQAAEGALRELAAEAALGPAGGDRNEGTARGVQSCSAPEQVQSPSQPTTHFPHALR